MFFSNRSLTTKMEVIESTFLRQRRRIEELGRGGDSSVMVEYHVLSDGVRIAGLVMMSLSIATAITLAVWVLWNRKAGVVRMMQPPFLLMVCFGAVLTNLAIIPMGANDQNTANIEAACLAMPWLASIGDIIIIAALLSKLLR